ncbi:MAG: DMT family transporter [Planctomycetes bacterium]|nr:DMT family transporter [Planctomycetota bacterium]
MQRPAEGDRAGGVAFIIITLVGWASVPLFLKYLTAYIDGWTANGWRYGISALLWAPALLVGARRGTLPRHLWRAAVVPAAVNIFAQCCFAWAPYYINPGLLTFMLRLQIIFVAVGTYLLFPAERPILRSARYWGGVIIVLGGLAGLCLLGAEPPRGARAFGIALAIVAGVFYGGYALSVRHFMHDVHPVTAFAAISGYTALGLNVMMLALAEQHGALVWTLSAAQLGVLVGSALVGIAITHVLYYAALARLGVAICAGVILLQPFLSSIGSYFWFGERLTTAQWLSGAAAMGGAGLMLLTRRQREPEARKPGA